ncbi:isocitrate lyase/PEP mutase family protein [Thalassobaculum sp.]|uniref:isocitrate lyase/PEP mutase family protein n=1 Tax=Thalassobaculum sp. TaxID=2022740 RepID=UPI0032EFD91C
MTTHAPMLRALLTRPGIAVVPSCFDAMSARLIERAGFDVAFMSGFAVSATQLVLPDAGLISYEEMVAQGRRICDAVHIPVIGDADTGFGNPVNVKRTVRGYHRAGFACAMIEDQVYPKRCGYAHGLAVVDREEATTRLRAALDARAEIQAAGGDILVIGRTDSRGPEGFEEALWRAEAFADLGADIVYFEGPQSEAEMAELNRRVAVPTMLAQVEKPDRALLSPKQAEALGYDLALFGLTLLNASLRAMHDALALMAGGNHPGSDRLMPFDQLYETVGFDGYYAEERRYGPADGSNN